MTTYVPTTWVNDSAPPISAANLNHIEGGLATAIQNAVPAHFVVDGSTADFNITGRLGTGFSVPTIQAYVTDRNTALDVMVNGSPGEVPSNGFAWIDVVDVDLIANSSAVGHHLRLGITSAGPEIGSRVVNGGSPLPIQFTIGGTTQATFAAGGFVLLNGAGYGAQSADASTTNNMGAINGVGYIGPTTNHPLALYTNSTEKARIDVNGNFGLGVTAWGTSSVNVIGIKNGTAPASSPSGMGQLYVLNGALTFRGSSGTITTVAVA